MPRAMSAEERRIKLVTSAMLDIRDQRMAMEAEIFQMADDMRSIRAKRLTRAADLATFERDLRVRRGNPNGPLTYGDKQLMKLFENSLK